MPSFLHISIGHGARSPQSQPLFGAGRRGVPVSACALIALIARWRVYARAFKTSALRRCDAACARGMLRGNAARMRGRACHVTVLHHRTHCTRFTHFIYGEDHYTIRTTSLLHTGRLPGWQDSSITHCTTATTLGRLLSSVSSLSSVVVIIWPDNYYSH